MNNYFCFKCSESFSTTIEPNYKVTNKYGDWDCIKHSCSGDAKYIGHSITSFGTGSKLDKSEQRKQHADDLVQPYLPDGNFNGRFKELYPEQTKTMIEEKAVTKTDVTKAKKYKGM